MAAGDVRSWTIIHSEEDNNDNTMVSDPKMNENSVAEPSTIKDYFGVIGERERKCRLCAATIMMSGKTYWNLKRHLKAKHFTEWANIEHSVKTPKAKKTTIGNSNTFELIPADVASTDGHFCAGTNTEPNGEIGHYHQTGNKRVRFAESFNDDLTDDSIGWNAPSNGIDATDTDATMQMFSKEGVTRDENTIFCEFIANEMRNLKTDKCRRKLKLIFQKCLVEMMEEEEAMLAKNAINDTVERDTWISICSENRVP